MEVKWNLLLFFLFIYLNITVQINTSNSRRVLGDYSIWISEVSDRCVKGWERGNENTLLHGTCTTHGVVSCSVI